MLIVRTGRFGAGDESSLVVSSLVVSVVPAVDGSSLVVSSLIVSSLVVSSLVVSVVPAVDGLSFVEVRGRGFAAIQILQKKRKRNRNVSTSQYKPQRTITNQVTTNIRTHQLFFRLRPCRHQIGRTSLARV